MNSPSLSLELSLPSELGYEVVARDAVAAFARCFGIPAERIEDLKTALCEACINAMEHGNALDPRLRVQIRCQAEAECLIIEVLDQRMPTYSSEYRTLSIGEKLASMGPCRGMGLMLISRLCDEAGFVTDSGPGHRLRLTFYR